MQGGGEPDVEDGVDAGRQLNALAAAALFPFANNGPDGTCGGLRQGTKGLEPNAPHAMHLPAPRKEAARRVRRACMLCTYDGEGDRDGQFMRVLSTTSFYPLNEAVMFFLVQEF